MVLHCFLVPGRTLSYLLALLVDVGLTSSIAAIFMWAGLADIFVIDAKSRTAKISVYGSIVALFVAYFYGIAIANRPAATFIILYSGVVGITCTIYLVTQIILLWKMKSLRGVGSLVTCGWSGGIGFAAVVFISNDVCNVLGPYWSSLITPEFIWFILSDVSVYYMFLYVYKSRNERAKLAQSFSLLRGNKDKKKRDKGAYQQVNQMDDDDQQPFDYENQMNRNVNGGNRELVIYGHGEVVQQHQPHHYPVSHFRHYPMV